jgi:hypothetical protein
MIAFAQTTLSNSSNLGNVVSFIIGIIGLILPVLVGIAFLAFLFGIVKFIFKSGDAKNHAEGIAFMKWSLIALFILVSFMGIISFFYSDLGFNSGAHPLGIPQLPQ